MKLGFGIQQNGQERQWVIEIPDYIIEGAVIDLVKYKAHELVDELLGQFRDEG